MLRVLKHFFKHHSQTPQLCYRCLPVVKYKNKTLVIQKGKTFCQRWITVDTFGKIDPEKLTYTGKVFMPGSFWYFNVPGFEKDFHSSTLQIHIQKVELLIIVDVSFRNETRPADLW